MTNKVIYPKEAVAMADSENVLEARETGVESVDCPNCGKSLNVEVQPDGSSAAEACSKCFKEPTKKSIREQSELQQSGILARETGTNVEEN